MEFECRTSQFGGRPEAEEDYVVEKVSIVSCELAIICTGLTIRSTKSSSKRGEVVEKIQMR